MINKKIAKQIASYNDEEYNFLKLAEELSELNEVVIKSVTKSKKSKPSKAKLVEECGDVLVRIFLLSEMLEFDEELQERIDYKIEQILANINEKEISIII